MDEPNSERVITPMPTSLVRAIDDYRFSNRIDSRAETVRRLLRLGLEAAQAQPDATRPTAAETPSPAAEGAPRAKPRRSRKVNPVTEKPVGEFWKR